MLGDQPVEPTLGTQGEVSGPEVGADVVVDDQIAVLHHGQNGGPVPDAVSFQEGLSGPALRMNVGQIRQQQQTGYLQLMEALLEAGADVNARLSYQLWFTEYGRQFLGVDRMGATPFWRAAHATDVAAMSLLAAYGADPEIPTRKPLPHRH